MMIKDEVIKAYALKNAIEHDGKAIPGAVVNSLFNEGLKREEIKDAIPRISDILNEVNSCSLDEQRKQFDKLKKLVSEREEREGLRELDNVNKKKGVIMRFAPSASGPMHIGHVLTGMLSSLYVKKYGGKFYVRIEDTNPENIYEPAYKMIPEEGDWIFGNVKEYIIQSDRMELYYKYIKNLLEKEAIYVCCCDAEKFRELIMNKKQCPCRGLSKKKNLERWEKMLNGEYKEGEAVIRFKSDVNHPNPAMRDFPLARVNTSRHARQGKKYRVWPLMNLSVAIDDIESDMTHIIRGKDHKDNAERQRMIYNALNKKFPMVYFIGRYNFTDMELSTSKTRQEIEKNKYSGWDDIRLPFVAALRKRGYQPEAFVKLVEEKGMSEVDKVIKKKDFFELLDLFNREAVREKARRVGFKEGSKNKSNSIIFMPDGKEMYGDINGKMKRDEVVHILRLGYARYNGIENGKKIFWFAHP
jgi:glutamyl-tRNA synthetase